MTPMASQPTALNSDSRGYWYTQWYDDSHGRHTKTFGNKSTVTEINAQRRLKNWLIQWRNNNDVQNPTDAVILTVDSMADVEAVVRRVVARGGGENEIAVAWLHDVIEDATEAMLWDDWQSLPTDIKWAVAVLTKVESETYESHPIARAVKVADMLSNLADDPTKAQILKYAKGLLFLLDRPMRPQVERAANKSRQNAPSHNEH